MCRYAAITAATYKNATSSTAAASTIKSRYHEFHHHHHHHHHLISQMETRTYRYCQPNTMFSVLLRQIKLFTFRAQKKNVSIYEYHSTLLQILLIPEQLGCAQEAADLWW